MASAASSRAFVVGYTGASGKELVKVLAASNKFEEVVLIGRRKVEYESPELQKLVRSLKLILVTDGQWKAVALLFCNKFAGITN